MRAPETKKVMAFDTGIESGRLPLTDHLMNTGMVGVIPARQNRPGAPKETTTVMEERCSQ